MYEGVLVTKQITNGVSFAEVLLFLVEELTGEQFITLVIHVINR